MTTANLSEPELPAPPIEKDLPVPQYHDTDSKPLIILLCVVLLASLVGTGIFLLSTKQNQPASLPQFKPITTITPTATSNSFINTEATDSANWKIYTNTKYGYRLQYPSTWLVQAMNNTEELNQTSTANFRTIADKTPAESGFSLSVISNPKNLSLTDWVKQNSDNGVLLSNSTTTNSSTVSLNGLGWEKINDNSIGYVPTGYVKYGLAHGGNLYYIVLYSADEKTLDQILSTFKFTN